MRAGDIVILHDPQTAALARAEMPAGVSIVWRCHVGIDNQNEHSARAWAFLRPYLDGVDAFVFSRAQFAPAWVTSDRLAVIPPSIDPFSAKNELIEPDHVRRVLQDVGLLAGGGGDGAGSRSPAATGRRGRSAPRRPARTPDRHRPRPVPIVLQASRWDVMKDMPGVMIGFAEGSSRTPTRTSSSPAPNRAASPTIPRPTGSCACLASDLAAGCPNALRRRVHLACVPMADGDEAATIVNALQRHAAVVVQKSLAEGFGLTVTEAMWKARPVVGSAVGGIVDQIVSGETGWLVDAHDLEDYARAVRSLLDEPIAERMGAAGRDRATPISSATAISSNGRSCSNGSRRIAGVALWAIRPASLDFRPWSLVGSTWADRVGHITRDHRTETTMTNAVLDEMSLEECLCMLRENAVGRIAVVVDEFPIVLPVNYRLAEASGRTWLAVRTRPGNVLDRGSMHAAFEIDGIDSVHRQGWSVLVRGTLQHVDPDAADFRTRFDPEPWLTSERDAWLVIEPFEITGRRLRPAEVEWAFQQGAYI